jgi:hypothetical protein
MEQAGQPPGGTVKDQIAQQTGVMALKQSQQQQAMQNMAQQGMAQQGMRGGAPAPQQPVMAAASGGLASLRPGYRSGGVIAFQEAGSVDEAVEEEADAEEKSTGAYSGDAKAVLTQLMQEAAARRKMQPPKVESRDETTKRMIKEDPNRYGILNKPIGEDAMTRLEELQNAKRAELATQKEELAKSKPGILQLLGQAALNSRGQQGGSALASILGGYSELSSGADAKQLQQEQGLRMRDLELQQAKAEAMSKVEDAKRSQANGDINKAREDILAAQKIAKDHNVSLNTLLGKQLTTASSVVESERKGKDAALKRELDAKIAQDRIRMQREIAFRPGEKERQLAKVDKLRKDNKPDEAAQLLKDIIAVYGGGAADVGRDKSTRLVIEAQLRTANNVLTNSSSKPAEKEAAKADIARLNKQLRNMGPKDEEDGEDTAKPTEILYYDASGKLIKG